MKDARQVSQTPVRLPEEIKAWLKHKAIDNHRSLNGEILARLEESRKREEEEIGQAA
ncbi:Arc family DNA-binding protein [Chromobacterium violaceum]